MKKKLAIVLAALMASGSLTTIQAASITFSDINNVPWKGAETYINKAAEADLMVGEINSKGQRVCRPKDQVTYCETMQLAYNILKTGGKLGDTTGIAAKWKAVMDGYNIPTWAQEAVGYGLEKNILTVNDVSRFMAGANKNNYAKREDVAVIFGKALVTRTSYTTAQSPSLSFGDKAKIASTSTPYVELLNRLGIIVGDNNNNFNPRNDINRSEMAVVSVKTNDLVSGSGSIAPTVGDSVRGVINTINTVGNQSLLTLETTAGSRSFLGTSNVKCAMESTGTTVNFSDLTQGDVVTVYYSGTDIKSIVVHSKVATTTVSGTIDQANSTRIYLSGKNTVSTGYDLAAGCTVTLNNAASSLKNLIDATSYYTVDATLTLNGSKQVTKIVASTTEGTGTTGTLTSLSTSRIKIKRSSNTETTYTLAESVVYKLNNEDSTYRKVSAALDEKDKVTVTLYFNNNDEVIRVYASTNEEALTGTISTSITATSFRMRSAGGSTKTYYLADGCTFRLDGANTTRSKLNDAIDRNGEISATLTLDKNGDVSRIAATTNGGTTGTVTKRITATSLTLIPTGKTSSSSKTYTVATNCKYTLDGSASDRNEINSCISDNGSVEVSLTLDSDNRVTKVAAKADVTTVKGIISSEMSESYLRIKLSGKTSTTRYYLDDNTTYKLDGSTSTWAKVNRAIRSSDISATLTLDGNTVTKLVATTDDSGNSDSSGNGSVTYLDDSEIKVDGERFYLADGVTVTLNGSSTTLARLITYYENGDEMDATLTTDRKGDVTRIKAYTRKATGELRAVYTDSMELSVAQDGANRLFTIRDTSSSSCKYYVDGEQCGGIEFFYDEVDSYRGTIKVTLTMDSNGLVTRVDATLR